MNRLLGDLADVFAGVAGDPGDFGLGDASGAGLADRLPDRLERVVGGCLGSALGGYGLGQGVDRGGHGGSVANSAMPTPVCQLDLTANSTMHSLVGMTTEKHTHCASYMHSISSGWDLHAKPGDLGRAHGTCRCGVKVTRAIAEGGSSASNYRPWVDYDRFDAEMEAHEINDALVVAATPANDPLALLRAQGVRDAASGSSIPRTEGIRVHYGDAAASAYAAGLTDGLQANATGQRTISPSTRIGMKRGSRQAFPALHVVTGVRDWRSGITATSECGLKCDVLEAVADDRKVQLCQRCRHSLGWDIKAAQS